MPMTSNPFAPRITEQTGFDARHVFDPPRLEKVDATNANSTMIEYSIYCAGAPHLAQFSLQTGIPVYKIGVARYGAHNRLRGLRRHRYAGYWGRPGDDVASMTALIGADSWVQIRLRRPHDLDKEADRYLLFEHGGITIRLPGSLHPETVDRMVDDLLANISLRRVLTTEPGQLRLRNGGVDPNAWFHTHYLNADRPAQLAEARELYAFEPREQTTNLVRGLTHLVQHCEGLRHGGG